MGETFEIAATKMKKLSARDVKAFGESWKNAQALNKSIAGGTPDEINMAAAEVESDGDFGALVVYAEAFIEIGSERREVRTGLNTLKMPENRSYYWLYVPQDYDPKKEYILILGLHGAGGRAKPLAQVWIKFADANGAIVVAPKSVGRSWNTGSDAIVIAKAVKEVCSVYNIARNKRAVFGFSAGAAISYFTHFLIEDIHFQALIAACGHMQMAKLRGEISKNVDKYADRIKGVRFCLVTGSKDHARGGVKTDSDFLKKHGGIVKFTQVEGMGHSFGPTLMPPLYEWLSAAFGEEE